MNLSRRRFFEMGGTAAAAVAATGCGRLPYPLGSLFEAPNAGPFQASASKAVDLITHVLNRLCYGAPPGEYERVGSLAKNPADAVRAYIEEQLQPETIDDSVAERVFARFEVLNEPAGEMFEYKEKFLLSQMVLSTVMRAAVSQRQLYEVMVQFWTDHFNIDPSKGDCRWLKAWDDRAVIRKYALGDSGLKERTTVLDAVQRLLSDDTGPSRRPSFKFPDLLRASALSPAMLWYLDGKENRKASAQDKPNENYARELLELHTLGVHGGYTQKDVMEVARCLTGWTVRGNHRFSKGRVEFKAHLHDDGPKEVLGHHLPAGLGAGDLDRVLGIVSLHPATGRHIASKLCRRFISDAPTPQAISSVADSFLKSGGDIRSTLRTLFGTEEFLAARGVKYKRPFQFVVSALRATGAQVKPDKHLVDFLERMGHVPFHYPTPDGYPEEPEPWMGTMLWRWNFAVALNDGRINGVKVNRGALERRAGGERGLMAHILGRTPTMEEVQAYHKSGAGLALLLASPAFQRC